MDIAESFFRWMHVVAGILWIGLLYFFNWINSQFAPTLDAESKKKVLPELLPRTLYWFRWGAAYTWITGLILIFMVYYHGKLALEDQAAGWQAGTLAMIAVTFLGVFLYDILYKTVLTDPIVGFGAGAVMASAVAVAYDYVGLMSYRGTAIHLGALFGTIMAYNVWFRIWPAQQKIITAIKAGDAPDGALVKLAGLRSKHNTYMSVPLLFLMTSQHATWAANPITVTIIVLVGFALVNHIYARAAKVPGF
jgi:uncharacterized membrane protein